MKDPENIEANKSFDQVFSLFALFLLIVVGMIIVMSTDATRYAVLPLFALVLFWVALVSGVKIYYGIAVLIFIVPLQPFFTMYISQYLYDSIGVKILVSLKESIVMLLLAVSFFKNFSTVKLIGTDYLLLFFVFVYVVSLFTSSAQLFVRIVSVREGVMIGMLYFLGRYSNISLEQLKQLLRAMIVIAILVALFGYAERFFFDSHDWQSIGALKYMEHKFGEGNPGAWIINGLPSQWYSYIGVDAYRRMVSSIGDAPTLSRYLAFSLLLVVTCYSVITKNKNEKIFLKYILSLIFFCAMLLAIGRGGILLFFLAVLFFYFRRYKPILVYSITAVFSFLVFASASGHLNDPVLYRHVKGLVGGVGSLIDSPFGHGLGVSGQMAVLYGENKTGHVEESFIGSLSIQLGVIGVVSFIVFMVALIKILETYSKRSSCNDIILLARLSSAFVFGVFITSFFANSSISPIAIANVFILSGALITIHNKMENRL